ncbi:hypothetical protein GLOIN_2v1474532 [Rhizophagus clarus]|nr:hypothetical protein GLOIN_2v1474532 [Rhizophagus clarus]
MTLLEEHIKEREKELKELKEYEKELKECEKELYSKECVIQSINFVVDEASKKVPGLKEYEKFSCYLATILAREKQVVVVWLRILLDSCEIHLSKNFAWLDYDLKYIDKIMKYLKDISNNAPAKLSNVENAFTETVMLYCSAKLESRLKKLKDYIKNNSNNEHVKSFKDFFLTNINYTDSMTMISYVCNLYYKEVKDKQNKSNKSKIPLEFLEYIKKVGSYAGSMSGIIDCARNIQFKQLFFNVKVFKRSPVIINNQSIYSWKNIIRRFIDEEKYKEFMDKCLNKTKVMERMRKVYTDNTTQQQQLLNDDDVKQCIYLHAEMNILTYIIDNKINGRTFIAVSKKCCYLCELYINFARDQGYNIIVTGNHKKVYSGWKLPNVKDSNFKIRSLRYILKSLDQIIGKKLEHYTRSLPAVLNSNENSLNPNNSNENMDTYYKNTDKKIKKFSLF